MWVSTTKERGACCHVTRSEFAMSEFAKLSFARERERERLSIFRIQDADWSFLAI